MYLASFCSMQSAEQQQLHQESQTARLAHLELLLNNLAAQTEVHQIHCFSIEKVL